MPSSSSLLPAILLSLTISSTFLFLPSQSADSQVLPLLQWKNTLNGASEALSSWRPTDPTPCNWYGVLCNPSSQVIVLNLSTVGIHGGLPSNFEALKSLKTLIINGANITGKIPKSFGEYRELSFLDLSENQISGEIPADLFRLTKLEFLALNSNSLVGSIPPGVGNLSRLTYLTLFDNYLTGYIPSSIGKLTKLEVFRAGGNQNLGGPLPPEIGNCSNLVMLGLAETGISGSLPLAIGSLRRIQTIAIYTAFLSGPIPIEIGNCSELKSFYLYQNSLSGSIPTELRLLQKLQSLLLWQNSFMGSIPPELGECGELMIIDLSLNLFTGNIPSSFGKLSKLHQLQLSTNQLTGTVPPELSNCTAFTDIEIDNNDFSGEIMIDFGKLQNLTLFYAWQNRLTGNIPASLAECGSLQSVDLSYNNLTGVIPRELFSLQNLSKLLLIANELSGFIPPEIGNCTNLFRLRLNQNQLAGVIPPEIGNLRNLNFLDMSENLLVDGIPPAISGCKSLQFLDLHSNCLTAGLPESLPINLQFLDVTNNLISGELPSSIMLLQELTKLLLGRNKFTGRIPSELSHCTKLQQLDLGENSFSGTIPPEIGLFPSLEISLNLSCNQLSGNLPLELSQLKKLAILDLSHNSLSGDLAPLATLQNLASLNISFNTFSGELPDTPFFRKIPLSDLTGNDGLHISSARTLPPASAAAIDSQLKLAMSLLFSFGAVLLLVAAYALIRARRGDVDAAGDGEWDVTLYQKSDLSVQDMVNGMISANVIGTGSSGVVYRVGEVAVKRMWSVPEEEESGSFLNEITTLGAIRHRNIVRLLGWGSNRRMRLLFYKYLPNGSLSANIHRGGKKAAGWEERYGIVLGLAEAVAYLHHDCVPPILHGDVKAMNVLLGEEFEPYLADFGLASVFNGNRGGGGGQGGGTDWRKMDTAARSPPRRIQGSYGYMAPELASMQRITLKSDVYSYGVVLLEVLTGHHPLDPSFPGGIHLVQWARDHLQAHQDPTSLLDARLIGLPASQMQEMVQALDISVLCVSPRPSDRPTMKDVVALLKEIIRPPTDEAKVLSTGVVDAVSPAGSFEVRGSSNCSCVMSDYSS